MIEYPRSMCPGTPRVDTGVPPEYILRYPQNIYPGDTHVFYFEVAALRSCLGVEHMRDTALHTQLVTNKDLK